MSWRLAAPMGVTLAIAASGASVADDTQVSELVVTGARLEETLPQTLSRYGSDLETITADTVRRNVYVDVSQALQMQTPGLFLSPRNGPFSYADISLQGSRTGDVLWLVDGVRINNRLYTSTSPADTLPASMVERIEVLKGGQSLFYGTQAAAGVINIVTRPYADAPEATLTVGGHTNSGVHADVLARAPLGPARLVAWASKDEAEGYRTFDVFQPSATARRRGYDVVSFGGKLGLELSPTLSTNLYVQHTDAHLDYPGPRLTRLSFNDRDEDIASLSLDWTPGPRAGVSIKGYYHDWDSVYSTVNNVPGAPNAPPVIVDDLTYWGYEDYGVSVLARLQPHAGVEYELGYDYQNFRGRDDVLLIAPRTERVHAVIAQARTTDDFSQRVRLSAGLRHNRTGGDHETVWTAGGRWEASADVYVESRIGTSFILPSAEQLFGIDPCCAVGNPDLKPERALNGSLAVGGEAGRVAWQLTGFARRIENLIVDVYDRPGFPDGVYANTAGVVRTRGLEASARAALGSDLAVRAAYILTRTREAGAGAQLIRIPKAQAKAGVTWEPAGRPFGASASLVWTGDVFQTVTGFGRVNYGDATVLDLAAYLDLGRDAGRRLTVRLENALDEAYATRVASAAIDLSTQRFLYQFRGVPRTLHVSYAHRF